MTDCYTLFAKIQALPKRRIAEVEDFVDFLTLRRSARNVKPLPSIEEKLQAIDDAKRVRLGLPPRRIGLGP